MYFKVTIYEFVVLKVKIFGYAVESHIFRKAKLSLILKVTQKICSKKYLQLLVFIVLHGRSKIIF